uniref:G-type lectin S-receptor-like serine/threonine-protein kinase LECRK1 n=1 Tax=Elaeis guineensis var. tenera TaxID=51953 RepID=A0A8N4F076_ELAGV|nr:G-type lectin S-receptor-like serine/threonine-protein kinase LECRK1 [Elaeis guineensis]
MTLTTMFLVLMVGFALVAAQTGPRNNITIGSTLSPTTPPTSWLSASGRFAFGFYPPGNNPSTIGVWLTASPTETVIVWTLLQKPFRKDALLNLTNTGLELVYPKGEPQSIIKFHGTSVLASMLDSGNFVAYRYDGNTTYKSFDHPSDTIMGGQSLRCGTQLTSSVSETNYSSGTSILIMQCDGNLVLYQETVLLWASETYGAGYTSLILDTNGAFYLQSSSGENMSLLRTPNGGTEPSIFHGKLGWNGTFQLKWLRLETNMTVEVTEIPDYKDRCEQKETCGFNSICTLIGDQQPNCSCLTGFANATGRGCQRNFTKPSCKGILDTNQYSMEAQENIIWLDDPYSVKYSSREDCQDACLKDCNCDAALFRDQKCAKQKLPLQGGRTSMAVSTEAFLKVLRAPPIGHQDAKIEKVVNTKAVTISLALVARIYCFHRPRCLHFRIASLDISAEVEQVGIGSV